MKRKGFKAILTAVAVGCLVSGVTVNAAGIRNHITDYEWEQLYLTNRERINQGREPFSTFTALAKAAQKRAKEQTVLFSHYRPDGTTPWSSIFEEYRIPYGSSSENIAAGYSTPELVTRGWMESPGHRRNILEPEYTHMGVGNCEMQDDWYGYYWAQDFIGRCSFSDLALYDTKSGKTYTSKDVLKVEKGTDLESLELAGRMQCVHGVSVFPFDNALCSGYDAELDDGKAHTVTLQAYGMETPIQVAVLPELKEEKAPVLNRKPEGRNTVSMKWSAVNGAEKYEVYRKENKEGTYRKIAAVTGLSYKDKKAVPGRLYYYRVRAVRGNRTGKYSTARSVRIVPETPVLTGAVPLSGRVKVSWNPLKDADGYEIWCKTGNGSYKRVRNILSGQTQNANHFNLKKGNSYTYKVRAFWTEGGKRITGEFSGTKRVTL